MGLLRFVHCRPFLVRGIGAARRPTRQNQPSSVSTHLRGGPAPMDIGALHNKRAYKGRAKAKEKEEDTRKEGNGKKYKGKGIYHALRGGPVKTPWNNKNVIPWTLYFF